MTSSIKLTKIDVSRSQLETAIKLFFLGQDIVSIHTLTNATHQVLYDIAHSKMIKSTLIDEVKIYIKSEHWKDYNKIVRKAGNYFKHADNDLNETLEFSLEESEFLIFDSILLYIRISKDVTSSMSSFMAWFYLKYPNTINPTSLEDMKYKYVILETKKNNTMNPSDKLKFFDLITQIEEYKNNLLKTKLDSK